ncbi:unnamed protein product [Nezara viridula]|uniref:TIR domain-containing protein n=1 Tax=Nezara viridula TaxID=85310 RepID=A0A9P0HEV4_NEZVI|nr:unnamed protein product [Nezara viridula]
MLLATLLVGVLWFQSQEVLSDFQCPGTPADCACSRGKEGNFELLCPNNSNPIFRATFLPNQFMDLLALEIIEWEDLKLMSGLKIGPVNHFNIMLCPLPGISFKGLMATVGIPSTKILQVQSGRNLTDTLTSRHLEGLHELEELNLCFNVLTKLPEDLFKDVDNLKYLDLSKSKVQLLPKDIFRYVPKLETLDLGKNKIQYLEPGIFRNLTKLRLLNLSENKLKKLSRSVFSDVPNLERLDLNSNGLTTLPPDIFADFIKLKKVNLYENNFQTLPQSIFRNTPNLEQIQIHNNRRILKTLPSGLLANLTKLKELNLGNISLSSLPEDLLSGCISLDKLTLRKNLLMQLPDKIFQDIKNVTMIDLAHNRLRSLPESLFSSLQKLKKLDMSHNNLTNISQSLFSSLYVLEELKLADNEIKFIHPEAFAVLQGLKTINLSHNKLSVLHREFADEELGSNSIFQTCVKLEVVDLSYNELSTIYSDWRVSMVNLQHLDLSYNDFTNLTIYDLQFKSGNLKIDLSSNKIHMVYIKEAEKLAKSLYQTNSTAINYSINVILTGNPFVCDCNAYHLVAYFKNQLEAFVYQFWKFGDAHLSCDSPEELKGTQFKDLDLGQLTCPAELPLENNDCPKNCSCKYWSSDTTLYINCSYRGLTNIPPSLPTSIQLEERMDVNHTELDLRGNKITFLPNRLGNGYSRATKIYLSYNNLTSINLTSFSDKLQVIEIDNNNLTRMDEDSLIVLAKSKHIKTVSLQNNPWICDCQSTLFLLYTQANKEKITNLNNLKCSNGIPFSELTATELCRTMTTDIITLSVTLVFICLLVGSFIGFFYQMEIKVWLYANKLCRFFGPEEELDKDKLYDAFVSYSHQDEKFVLEDLVPGLENSPRNFKLCLHYRDWVVGEFIPHQIARSVEESRRTIIVLSPNFLKSVWGRMEFRTAHSQALSEGRARVIIILYDDIGPTANLDPELKAYLSMNTYVKWGDPWFWEKLRYVLPRPP